MCTIPKVIGLNEKTQICLWNNEYLRDNRCERPNTAATGKNNVIMKIIMKITLIT